MLEILVLAVVLAAAVAAGAVAWSYRRFMALRRRALEHLRAAAPEMAVAGLTDVGFTVAVLGTEVEVDLASLARQRPRTEAEAVWLDRVVAGIRAQVPAPRPAPYALVEDRVLPQLKPAAYAEVFDRYPPPLRLVWRPFAPGAVVTYVIGAPHQRTAITAGVLRAWGVDPDALHARALENLRRETAHMLEEIGGPRRRYEHLDGFDATRILVADLIVPEGIADPLVAIPEETVLLIAPASEQAALAAEAATRQAAADRPLSPHLFRGPHLVVL